MGNIQNICTKVKSYLTVGNNKKLSYFECQQALTYSKQTGKKCLQHMVDVVSNIASQNTLQKIHKILHPALKYIIYCQSKSILTDQNMDISIQQNFVLINRQELMLSAGNILQMYIQFLRKVVPANISYFHFMRQKDFYIHYNALKYVLNAGHPGNNFKQLSKTVDVFNRLKTDNRLQYIKLFSHWLYDMVKYRCSAIYLKSQTLPHLIVTIAIILCGLLYNQNINILQQYNMKQNGQRQKLQIYQHTLYSFAYILTQTHPNKLNKSSQGNGCIQVILIGIKDLIKSMWTNMRIQQIQSIVSKCMYAPSYWFADSVGFIKQPTLQKLVFLMIVDMIKKIKQFQQQILANNAYLTQQNMKLNKQQEQQKYNKFIEEQIKIEAAVFKQGKSHSHEIIGGNNNYNRQQNAMIIQQNNQQIIRNKQPYTPINTITYIMLYDCLVIILKYFINSIDINALQQMLVSQITNVTAGSVIRPYLLQIITIIQQWCEHKMTNYNNFSQNAQSQRQNQKYQVRILPKLKQYLINNSMDYQTQQQFIIPYTVLGKNCSIFVNKLITSMLKNYNNQIYKSDQQIWTAIVSFNRKQMRYIGK